MVLRIIAISLLATACTTFGLKESNFTLGESARSRVFSVKAAWIERAPLKENLKFRKINRMTPVLSNSLVIQGNAIDGISAYSATNGSLVWRKMILTGVEPTVQEFKGRLYVPASDGMFYCLDTKTGREIWSFNTKAENLSEPLLDDQNGIIYFVTSASVIYALEADTGRQIWIHSRQDTSSFSIRGGGRPTLKDGNLFVGFSDGTLVSFNAKSGSIIWEIQLNKNKKFRDVDSSHLVDGDRVYTTGYDDKLYCLSTSKGDIIWKVEAGGYNTLSIYGNKLFFPTSHGELRALNKDTGENLWTYKLADGLATQAKMYKGLIVFGESQSHLVFLDPETGKKISSFEPGRGVHAAPAVDEKKSRIYFISGEANLYALDAQWSWKSMNAYIP